MNEDILKRVGNVLVSICIVTATIGPSTPSTITVLTTQRKRIKRCNCPMDRGDDNCKISTKTCVVIIPVQS
jgi:hypothetical protein